MPEVIAERYFRELVQRSLLQPDPGCYVQDVFTVHDLLRSLALFIARDEMLVMGDAWERPDGCSLVKLRRLCAVVSEEKSKAVLDATRGHDSLRTLMLSGLQLEETKRIEEVFEVALCPSPSLHFLGIFDFFGLHYPSWMANSSLLQNLRLLYLVNCIKWAQLPPLGELPSLDFLRIEGASAIVTIGPDFLGCEAYRCGKGVLFPKLTMLYLDNMPNWEQWQWGEEEEEHGIRAFPCLKMLYLNDCPKLRCLPGSLGHHATRLTNLIIRNCGSLERLGSISDLSSLQSLQLADGTIKSQPQPFSGGEQGHPAQFPTLKKLEIIADNQVFGRRLMDEIIADSNNWAQRSCSWRRASARGRRRTRATAAGWEAAIERTASTGGADGGVRVMEAVEGGGQHAGEVRGEGDGELEEALDAEEGLELGGGELLGGAGEQEAEDEDGEANGFGP